MSANAAMREPVIHEAAILGGGLAGLTAAARLVELGKKDIVVYAAGPGSTPYVAAINFVIPNNPHNDTAEQYRQDMMKAGYNAGNAGLVRDMTARSFDGYQLLLRWGAEFALESNGFPKLRHLSGHSCPRSLCSTTGLIGAQIVKQMKENLEKMGVLIHNGFRCVELLVDNNGITGALLQDKDGGLLPLYAPVVIAAWGGMGSLFGRTTYPADIWGNTLGMAKEAGAKLIDLEFLEYEPMVVLDPPGAVGEPCPTAMLGEGAALLNARGERFLLAVRPQGEAGSPKTLLNREIWKQVEQGNGLPHGGVYVDLRHIDLNVLKAYPWFYNRLIHNNVDPRAALIEVGPMAHSLSGGIQVDAAYQSDVPGLFAIGEACGGVHGACRCAGNAASQAVLSGLLCAEHVATLNRSLGPVRSAPSFVSDRQVFDSYVPGIRAIAEKALAPFRNGKTLEAALTELEKTTELPGVKRDSLTRQILCSVTLMARAALKRRETRGAHIRVDYPESQDKFEASPIIQ
jgi:aspartate oxidase